MTHPVPTGPRPSGLRRGVASSWGALLAVGATSALALPAPAAAAGPVSQPLVVLLQPHVARTRPDVHARRIETVAVRRPLTRLRTVLPVLDRARSRDGRAWVRVRLPGRPNAHAGWIPTAHTRAAATEWRLAVDLSARRVTVFQDARVVRRFRAIVGTSATPTPIGRFFIEEAVALAKQDAGSPFALATSARSNVLQEFNGGPGQIALHGTGNLPEALGTAASHGCVRLSPAAITWLARRVGRGVPLTITR